MHYDKIISSNFSTKAKFYYILKAMRFNHKWHPLFTYQLKIKPINVYHVRNKEQNVVLLLVFIQF
jgi:hypothetical protein